MSFKRYVRLLRGSPFYYSRGNYPRPVDLNRRRLLGRAVVGAGLLTLAPPLLTGCSSVMSSAKMAQLFGGKRSNIKSLGPLQDPDENGIRLPKGFVSRVVARTNEQPVVDSGYTWHWAPDGGAVFAITGGGWIYVSNSEVSGGAGGVGALVFGVNGDLRNAYSVLQGTSRNCGGGKTPWGTWLSCEEVSDGHVWECDPEGINTARRLDALGTFSHEAVAFDGANNQLYLTEDAEDGRLYRFTPAGKDAKGNPDLSSGVLEVAQLLEKDSNNVAWHAVMDPHAQHSPTRQQVKESTAFNGGEGIVYLDGRVFMVTKGDDRIWRYDIASQTMSVYYDAQTHPDAILTGVDNLTAVATGEIFAAEDGGDLQLVAILPNKKLVPVLQVVDQPNSEIAGPAFNQHGNKLYFSSQRGKSGTSAGGITYEISGPFFVN